MYLNYIYLSKSINFFSKSNSASSFGPTVNCPKNSTFFDYYFCTSDLCWKSFENYSVKDAENFDADTNFSNIFIPTKETSKISRMIALLTSSPQALLFAGESGTLKTATIRDYLSKHLDQENFVIHSLF